MRKNLITHIVVVAIFFLLVTLFRQLVDIAYLPLWIGGFVGAVLPDIDHLIYVYFLKPQELTSQRVIRMVSKGDLNNTYQLLRSTTDERKKLIFHNALLQVVFVVFAYLVMSSSTNLFGQGMVLGFLIHLAVDQFVDLTKLDTLSGWFSNISFTFDKTGYTLYWLANAVIILFLGLTL